MAYDTPQKYAQILAQSKGGCGEHKEGGCGCGGSGCASCEDEKCGCCPIGTVGVYNAAGEHVACLTPNDAEQFMLNSYSCPEGYVKYTFDGKFVGCVLPADYLSLKAAES